MNKGVAWLVTGHGKGKTTAALGQTIRALGHGWKVCFIQFVKGNWPTGESKMAGRLDGNLVFKSLGRGFTWEGEPEQHLEAGREAWKSAVEAVSSAGYDLVVLDELTHLIKYGVVQEQEAVELIRNRPEKVSLVITGSHAGAGLIEACDIVSVIEPVKYAEARARKGIEY